MLDRLLAGDYLTEQQAFAVMDEVMGGNVLPTQLASILTVLRFRGETAEEITGFAKAMRGRMAILDSKELDVVDTCGTGGDGQSTFNISTASAIALAALGVKVAKHGNRSVSSKSGSADVLEELGIAVDDGPENGKQSLLQKGMAFLFAPHYHPAMKHAAAARKEIGFRTVFNVLGPLCNPAGARKQIIGVYDTKLAEKLAKALDMLGTERAMFVTGHDGLDEISVSAPTDIVELNGGRIERYVFRPEDAGVERGRISEIQVDNPAESARLIKDIFAGNAPGSPENIVCLNAGAGLYLAGKAACIAEGVHMVRDAIQSGKVNEYYLSITGREVHHA